MPGTWKYSAEFRADAVELRPSAGRPIAQVAKEAGINHETLRHWVRSAAKLARLREQVSRFRFVEDHQRAVGVKRLCQVPRVSRSGSTAAGQPPWPASRGRRPKTGWSKGISTIHAESGGAYGDLGCTATMSVTCPAPATSASQ